MRRAQTPKDFPESRHINLPFCFSPMQHIALCLGSPTSRFESSATVLYINQSTLVQQYLFTSIVYFHTRAYITANNLLAFRRFPISPLHASIFQISLHHILIYIPIQPLSPPLLIPSIRPSVHQFILSRTLLSCSSPYISYLIHSYVSISITGYDMTCMKIGEICMYNMYCAFVRLILLFPMRLCGTVSASQLELEFPDVYTMWTERLVSECDDLNEETLSCKEGEGNKRRCMCTYLHLYRRNNVGL